MFCSTLKTEGWNIGRLKHRTALVGRNLGRSSGPTFYEKGILN